jgi:7,8-dihydropterin-6-yl-methyl-4-(beta-D-ribofuranosyl)aminobenzene 5'-phosphate synthase
VPGIFTTGVIEGRPPEQALVIETSKGLVVMTGCSHPGVVRMVEAAERQRGKQSVRFLLGGFHLLQDNDQQVSEKIAAAHCTGERAAGMMRASSGAGFKAAGAGQRFVFE